MDNNLEDAIFLDTENELNEPRSLFSRAFSKMRKDSLRGAIFIMLITALGTGVFTLHHFFNRVGIIWGIVMILITGIAFYTSADFLIFALKQKPECNSLRDLHVAVLNRPSAIFYDTMFLLYVLLVVIATIASLSKMFYINFESYIWEVIHVEEGHQTFDRFNSYFPFILAALLFGLVAQRSVSALRHLSLYSFLIFVFVTIICIYQLPMYFSDLEKNKKNTFNLVDIGVIGLFQTFGCLLFSFNIINNFYAVVSTVQNPITRRLRKIFSRTFFILALVSTLVGLSAYMSLGEDNTPNVDLFIFRDKIGDSDSVMFVGRCLLLISFITGCAVNSHSLKDNIFSQTGLPRNVFWHIILALAILFLSAFVVSNFSFITDFVSFAGSFCGTIMVFIFPSIIGYRVGYSKTVRGKILILLFLVVFGGLGMVSSGFAFASFFK